MAVQEPTVPVQFDTPWLDLLPAEDDTEFLDEGGEAKELRFGHAYWRRSHKPPDGVADNWLTVASAEKWAISNMTEKGMQVILEFGKFHYMPPFKLNTLGKVVPQWQPWQRPWDRILELGGAKLFPLDQVIAHNWHRECFFEQYQYNPDGSWRKSRVYLVRDGKVRMYQGRPAFPQLLGLDVAAYTFPCNMCTRREPFNYRHILDTHKRLAHSDQMQLETLRESQKIINDIVTASTGQPTDSSTLALLLANFTTIIENQNRLISSLVPAVMTVPDQDKPADKEEPEDEQNEQEDEPEDQEKVEEGDGKDDVVNPDAPADAPPADQPATAQLDRW